MNRTYSVYVWVCTYHVSLYVHIIVCTYHVSLYVHIIVCTYVWVCTYHVSLYVHIICCHLYFVFFSSDKTADGYEIQLQVNTAKVAFSVILLKMTALIIPWIVEHRELDRKRARPAILNVWRFGKPLKYSGLRAASEVPRSASRNSTALLYPYHGQFYG